MKKQETALISRDNNAASNVTKATISKIEARVKVLGLDINYAKYLIRNRYKVCDGKELTEAQAQSMLEHLEGYGGE